LTDRDPYAVLGVAVHADPDAIAAAYREQARRHHPDVSAEPDAERRMAEINAAWATLRDPARRGAWDRAHGRVGPGRPVPRRPTTHATHPGAAAGRHPANGAAGPGGGAIWRRGPLGEGAAGPPPGPRRGSVLPFGRHIGWSLGEVARVDPGYLVWLRDRREGLPYRPEIDALLAATRQPAAPPPAPVHPRRRRGLFR
jgi:curved DNA-binding protein CbpA